MNNVICKKPPSIEEKLGYSFLSGLIYIVIASPLTYRLMRSFFNIISPTLGNYIANASGLATIGGLILHTLLFSMVVFFIMIVIGNINEDFIN
jgi:hypothetical protein